MLLHVGTKLTFPRCALNRFDYSCQPWLRYSTLLTSTNLWIVKLPIRARYSLNLSDVCSLDHCSNCSKEASWATALTISELPPTGTVIKGVTVSKVLLSSLNVSITFSTSPLLATNMFRALYFAPPSGWTPGSTTRYICNSTFAHSSAISSNALIESGLLRKASWNNSRSETELIGISVAMAPSDSPEADTVKFTFPRRFYDLSLSIECWRTDSLFPGFGILLICCI